MRRLGRVELCALVLLEAGRRPAAATASGPGRAQTRGDAVVRDRVVVDLGGTDLGQRRVMRAGQVLLPLLRRRRVGVQLLASGRAARRETLHVAAVFGDGGVRERHEVHGRRCIGGGCLLALADCDRRRQCGDQHGYRGDRREIAKRGSSRAPPRVVRGPDEVGGPTSGTERAATWHHAVLRRACPESADFSKRSISLARRCVRRRRGSGGAPTRHFRTRWPSGVRSPSGRRS